MNDFKEVKTENIKEKKKDYSKYNIVMLIVLSIFITFMVTSIGMIEYVTNNPEIIITGSTDSEDETSLEYELLKYKYILEQYYLGDIDEDALNEGAIRRIY